MGRVKTFALVSAGYVLGTAIAWQFGFGHIEVAAIMILSAAWTLAADAFADAMLTQREKDQ